MIFSPNDAKPRVFCCSRWLIYEKSTGLARWFAADLKVLQTKTSPLILRAKTQANVPATEEELLTFG